MLTMKTLKIFLPALRQRTPGVIKSNYGGWQSDSVGRGHSVGIDTLVDNPDREIYEICKQTSLPQLEIYNIWINVNPKNCFNIQHDLRCSVYWSLLRKSKRR